MCLIDCKIIEVENKEIRRNSDITYEEIAIQISKSVRTVKTYMAEMQEKRLIERKNGKKNGEWILNY